MNRVRVIGIDPGFANFGIAAVELAANGIEILLDASVIHTSKSTRKREIRASDDKVDRAQQIGSALESWINRYRPVALCCEAMSFGFKNAATGITMGLVWGVIASVASRHGLPIVQASPIEIKQALCDKKNASKEEVIAAMEEWYGEVPWPKRKGDFEHIADAGGAVVACLNSPAIKMARSMARSA